MPSERIAWTITGFALACVLINITLLCIALHDSWKEY